MSIIALILIVALLIPIIGIVVDSPIGRAIARRMEGPQAAPPGLAELAGTGQVRDGRKQRALQYRAEEHIG